MAKHTIHSDSTGKYIIVVKGDTLSEIALECKSESGGKTYQQLATLNGISNPNRIYINQKIYLTKGSSGSSGSSAKTPDPNITALGVQSTDTGTLFATWTWSQHNNTESYEIKWKYDLGDGFEYIDKGSTDERQTTWSIPKGAKVVKFYVKPVSKTKDDKNKTTYFTADWTTDSAKNKWTNATPLTTPSNLKVEMDGCKLTATLTGLETSCPGATHIAFEVVKDNKTVIHTASNSTNKIVTGYASYTWTVDPGAEYKVRCYAYASQNKDGYRSEWTTYSDNKASVPTKVAKFTNISARKDPSDPNTIIVRLDWPASKTAETYEIEWYTNKELVGVEDAKIGSTSVDKSQTSCTLTTLAPGSEYFFRIRAVKGDHESEWSEIGSINIGTKPSAPTTWSSTTTVIAGEELTLYWVHNSADGSSETWANVLFEIISDGETFTTNVDVKNSTKYELKDKTSSCVIDTKTGIISWIEDSGPKSFNLGVEFKENVKIKWQVSTKGISDEPSEYSTPREIDVYSRPELKLTLGTAVYYRVEENNGVYAKTDEVITTPIGSPIVGAYTTENEQVYQYTNSGGEVTYYCCEITALSLDDETVSDLPVIKSFPFYISAIPGPKSQSPTSYHIAIYANSSYETTDNIGNFKMVTAGEQVYSQFFDVKYDLLVELSAGDINLVNNVAYTIVCTVSMNSGLTAEASQGFNVGWTAMEFSPNAEVGINRDTMTATVRPYCEDRRLEYRQVELSGRTYNVTDTAFDFIFGEPVKRAVTTTGEQVYKGVTADGDEIYFCEYESATRVTDVYISVYRREFDGSFTELETEIDGANNTAITDPHPALDYARYRIVAISKSTGSVSYYDLPGIPVEGKAVIIQWNEEWSSFEAEDEDRLSERPWSGSMLTLPYNIDVSDNTSPEVELIEYVGRKHPVSYYGTQRGQTATWSVVIEKDDEETLYGLRRLAMWMGDVYVREPSGSGYWANVKVSFNQKHKDLTIPVSLNITRVEGGI